MLVVTRSHHLVRHVHPNLMRAVGAHMIMCLSGAAHRSERNFHKRIAFPIIGVNLGRCMVLTFVRLKLVIDINKKAKYETF